VINKSLKNVGQVGRGESNFMMIGTDAFRDLLGVGRFVKFFVIEGRAKSGKGSVG